MELGERSIDPRFWHACAGGMVQMPLVNSKVFYFPQGHAEHSESVVNFGVIPRIPAMILCAVVEVKFLADRETDEVYARMRLVPEGKNEPYDLLEDDLGNNRSESADKSASFSKTLTQSDANNGGGFSVPRQCAKDIFPELDYEADPPVQNVTVRDVHGETWIFRHIYRGTPRRHLLTTGWSPFVNEKKLVAGDSIVFFRADNGDISVGIRRAKRSGSGGPESSHGWITSSENYGRFSASLIEDVNKLMGSSSSTRPNDSGGPLRGQGRVTPESVIAAASRAASGQPFQVVYYPRSNAPEFCVKASFVSKAMSVPWRPGMKFRMPFESDDSSRISWSAGTVSSVQAADPCYWHNSLWRFLQVKWEDPDSQPNFKCVSPWLVEVVYEMPHFSSLPPMKKLCVQQVDNSLDHLPLPPFSCSSRFSCLVDNIPTGIQGARHARYGVPCTVLHPNNKLQSGQSSKNCQQLNAKQKSSNRLSRVRGDGNDNISCLLTIGISSLKVENSEEAQTPEFILFGQPILTEQQMFHGCSRVPISKPPEEKIPDPDTEFGSKSTQCKVFLESRDTGWNLDLSRLASYEELYDTLSSRCGIEISPLLHKVLYCDEKGAVKHAGDEAFSVFARKTKSLTIVTNSGSNTAGRWDRTQIPSDSGC